MLRLNASTLSAALGRQLLLEAAHLRPMFHDQLMPLIGDRLIDLSLQRANAGSISLGTALSLFLTAYKRAPRLIAEVGTYIGNSAAAIAFGAGLSGQAIELVTCDIHPCTQRPLEGLNLPQGSSAKVVQGSSTEMLQALASAKAKLDMLHLDGRLQQDDLPLLAQLLKNDTLIALDDCEGDEKGHINLDVLRRSGLVQQHVFVEPFPAELFRTWSIETRSTTGLLLPIKLISITRQ
jgi:hypothetical protein